MRLLPRPDEDGRRFEQLPGGGAFNAANSATHAEFCERALGFLGTAGATVERGPHRIGPISVAAVVAGPDGDRCVVLAHGTFDDGPRAGMRRTDTLKKAGFDVVALRRWTTWSVLVVTSNLPRTSTSRQLLEILRGLADEVVAVEGDLAGYQRLRARFGGVAVPSAPATEVDPSRFPGQ